MHRHTYRSLLAWCCDQRERSLLLVDTVSTYQWHERVMTRAVRCGAVQCSDRATLPMSRHVPRKVRSMDTQRDEKRLLALGGISHDFDPVLRIRCVVHHLVAAWSVVLVPTHGHVAAQAALTITGVRHACRTEVRARPRVADIICKSGGGILHWMEHLSRRHDVLRMWRSQQIGTVGRGLSKRRGGPCPFP